MSQSIIRHLAHSQAEDKPLLDHGAAVRAERAEAAD